MGGKDGAGRVSDEESRAAETVGQARAAAAETQPSVSVVVPAYNAAETIARALDSVYAQTYPGVAEVIVVDDGSTDGTAGVVRERFPDAHYVRQPNAGAFPAKNRGVEAARAEYVAFLDADDEWLPAKLERQMQVCVRAPAAGLVTCLAEMVYEDSGFRRRDPTAAGGIVEGTFREWLLRVPHVFGGVYPSGWVVKRAAFEVVGLFSPHQAADLEFALRLTAQGYGALVMREALFNYYTSSTQVTSRPERKGEGIKRVMEYVRRCHPSEGAAWSRGILTEEEYADAFRQMVARFLPVMCAHGIWDLADELVAEAAGLEPRAPYRARARLLRSGLAIARGVSSTGCGRSAVKQMLGLRARLRGGLLRRTR